MKQNLSLTPEEAKALLVQLQKDERVAAMNNYLARDYPPVLRALRQRLDQELNTVWKKIEVIVVERQDG